MNIVIIGGGLGGLVLARVLQVHGIKSIVYESEKKFEDRSQGGLLDIHDYNGQLALKDAGLYDEFLKLIIPGADCSRILDKNGKILHEDFDRGQGTRPEVHRGQLRKMLIESLPSDTIRWDHKLTSVSALGDGKYEVNFAKQGSIISDLLIGAEGAWSKVRALLTDVKPSYVGTTFIGTFLYDSDKNHRHVAELVGGGTMMAIAPGKGLLTHKESTGTIHSYVAFNKPMEWFSSIDFSHPEAAREIIVNEFKDWAPALKAIVSESDVLELPRPIYALPVGHRWERKQGVTLLGDAAHLMSPFAGEGANLAMFDGAELGKFIIDHINDIETAITLYENEMFTRAEISAAESDKNLKLFFNENSPQSVMEIFSGH